MAAVGTVTQSSEYMGAGVTRFTWKWTASAGGAVSGFPCACKDGYLRNCQIIPSADVPPTNGYNLTLLDDKGDDVLNANQASSSSTTPNYNPFLPPLFVRGSNGMTVTVSGAGNLGQGTVLLDVSNDA